MLITTLLFITGTIALGSIVAATRPVRRNNPFYC